MTPSDYSGERHEVQPLRRSRLAGARCRRHSDGGPRGWQRSIFRCCRGPGRGGWRVQRARVLPARRCTHPITCRLHRSTTHRPRSSMCLPAPVYYGTITAPHLCTTTARTGTTTSTTDTTDITATGNKSLADNSHCQLVLQAWAPAHERWGRFFWLSTDTADKKRTPRLSAWGQYASRGTEGRTSSPRRRRGLRGVGVIGV